jgi:PII-like signaling protein
VQLVGEDTFVSDAALVRPRRQELRGRPMHGFSGERTLMRIHIGERDQHHGKPLYVAIVHLLRERHFAGVTVLRGISGFGASARIHGDKALRLSLDLPLVIECVETEERIAAILPELDEMIGGGLITLERAKVILYRPNLRRTPPGEASPPEAGERRKGSRPSGG